MRGRAVSVAGCCVLALLVAACQAAGHRAARVAAIGLCDAVPGYANHRSYPAGDPEQPPLTGRIVRCFASAGQAVADGYRVAAPVGTVMVDGVFLVPTGALTLRQCRVAARTLGYPVPCPGVAPTTSALTPPDCADGGGCLYARSFIFMEENFFVPPGYRGISGSPAGHFVLLAGPGADPAAQCGPGRRTIRVLAIEGDRAAVVECPPGNSSIISGHMVLGWVHRGVHVVVSFHGLTATNIDLDLAVAHHLVWVSPRG